MAAPAYSFLAEEYPPHSGSEALAAEGPAEPGPVSSVPLRLVIAEDVQAAEIEAVRTELMASDLCVKFAADGLRHVLSSEPYRTTPDGTKIPWLIRAYQRHRFNQRMRFAEDRKSRALTRQEMVRGRLLDLTAGPGEVLWSRHQAV